MPCLQVFAHSASCPHVWGSLLDCVCSEPAMSHGVLSWRQDGTVEEAVFVTSASCYSHGAFIHHYPHFNYNAACDNPFSCLHFCDVFQVVSEGHHCMSPEFCPLFGVLRRNIQGQNLRDFLSSKVHFAILSLSADKDAVTVCVCLIYFIRSCSWSRT